MIKSGTLYERISVGIVIHSMDGQIIEANPAASSILGLTPDQLLGKTSFDPRWKAITLDGKDFPPEDHPVMQTIKSGKNITGQILGVFIPEEEKYRWISIDSYLEHNSDLSEPSRVIVTFTDISERILYEKELMEKEERYKKIVESIPLGAVLCENENIFFNKSVESISGYKNEEIKKVSEWFEKLYPKNSGEVYDIYRQDKINNFPTKRIIPLTRKTGEKKWIEFSGYLDNNTEIWLLNDLTEKKNLEEDYEAIFNSINDAVFIQNYQTGEIIDVNQSMLKMYGFSSKSELFKAGFEYLIANEFPFNLDTAREYIRQAVEFGSQQFEWLAKSAKGDFFWVEVSLRLSVISGNKRILAVVRDISERKKSELVLNARIRINEYAAHHSVEDLFVYALDETEKLTKSKIGFYHFLENDQETISFQAWSSNTTKYFCSVTGLKPHYNIEFAGLWADCIRLKKPIIHNDFMSLADKKGFPDGHAVVVRELVVPVFRNNKIVSVLGVGNKSTDYNNDDLETVNLLADLIWDIVERKTIESRLFENEKKYRDLFQKMSNGFALHEIILDENGNAADYRFLEINNAFERMTGLKADEVINKNVKTIYPDLDEELIKKYGKVAVTQESVLFEYYFGNTDRHYEIFAYSPSPLKFAIILKDISENKLFADTLRILHTAVEQSPVSIVLTDPNGDIEYVNPKFEEVTGYKLFDVYRKNPRILKSGETDEKTYKQLWADISSGKTWRGVFVNRKKDGDLYLESAVISPVKNEEGIINHYIAVKEDITEKIQKERELFDTTRMANDLIESIPSGVFIYQYEEVDRLILIRANPEAIKITKLDPIENYLGKEFNELWPEAADDGITSQYLDSYRNNKGFETEAVFYSDNRISGAYRIRTFRIPNDRLAVAFEDVSERRKAEEEIKFQALLLDQIRDLITATDLKGNITYVNQAELKKFNLTREDLIGKNVEVYGSDPQIGADQDTIINSTLRDGFWRGEIVNTTSAGESFIVDCRTQIIYNSDNQPIGMIGISTDVTERKKMEKELIEHKLHLEQLVRQRTAQLYRSEEIFRNIAESSNDLIIKFNKDLQHEYVNPVLCRYMRRSLEEIINKTIDEVIETEDIRILFGKSVEKVFEQKNDIKFDIHIYDNTWIDWHLIPILSQNSEVDSVLAFGRDITERKKLEENILKALDREKELNEMKTNFLAMASHEYRTPLTSILTNAELLEMFQNDWPEEKRNNTLKSIQNSVFNMTKLLDEVLLISRTESGKLNYRPEEINLRTLCTDIMHRLEDKYYNSHSLKFNFESEKDYLNADKNLISHIIENLLSNAFKYSPKGSEIEYDVKANCEEIKIKIKDSGIGIFPEDINKLFEPFFRAKNIENIGGHGLGLSIVKKCVELHNGEIKVESKVGVGTIFLVSLKLNMHNTLNN